MVNIFRPITKEEKVGSEGITEVGTVNLLQMFMKKVSAKRVEYDAQHKPFDHYSARQDFEAVVKQTIGDAISTVHTDASVGELKLPDLDSYGNPDNFILVSSTNIKEDKLLDGIRTPVVTGKMYRFKAKKRGNTQTIDVPKEEVEEYENWLRDTKLLITADKTIIKK